MRVLMINLVLTFCVGAYFLYYFDTGLGGGLNAS